MIRFIDGPALGVELSLKRSPLFLRVTREGGVLGAFVESKWDALDQLSDTPRANEECFAYVLCEPPCTGFIDFRDGRGRRGEAFISAPYRLAREQPGDAVMRDTRSWQAWTLEAIAGEFARMTSAMQDWIKARHQAALQSEVNRG